MIKSELITRLALKNPHLYQREVEGVVNAFLGEIANAMRDSNRVELRGFGAFSVRVREARTGRNPKTGEPVDVEKKAAPFFRTGKEMRDRINASRPEEGQTNGSAAPAAEAEPERETRSSTVRHEDMLKRAAE